MNEQLTERQQEPMAISGVKLIIGIFFTAVGVLLTLDNLGIFESERILRFWPLRPSCHAGVLLCPP